MDVPRRCRLPASGPASEGGRMPSEPAILRKPLGAELRLPTKDRGIAAYRRGCARARFPAVASRFLQPHGLCRPLISSPIRSRRTIPGSRHTIDWDATIAYRAAFMGPRFLRSPRPWIQLNAAWSRLAQRARADPPLDGCRQGRRSPNAGERRGHRPSRPGQGPRRWRL
jgi:hypothetical protein